MNLDFNLEVLWSVEDWIALVWDCIVDLLFEKSTNKRLRGERAICKKKNIYIWTEWEHSAGYWMVKINVKLQS